MERSGNPQTATGQRTHMQHVAIIGAGPAGLMAADVVSAAGVAVTVFERMPSLGRKFLMAGRGGLNLTHSEDLEAFLSRYGSARAWLEPAIRGFPPTALTAFTEALGQETFTGTSGRVFPKAMKASPLLRVWLAKLTNQGVTFKTRQRWVGFDAAGQPQFESATGERSSVPAEATVLALGGASWPRLGSDGGWVPIVAGLGIAVAPLAPANCGVTVEWSEHLRTKFAGEPLKRIAITFGERRVRGEALITQAGLEGGAVYAVATAVREALAEGGEPPVLTLDLRPDLTEAQMVERLSRARQKISTSAFLHRTVGLPPVAKALLHEVAGRTLPVAALTLAQLIKALPLPVTGISGIERAISSAGGIKASEIDAHMMLRQRPGLFAAGEMLDWEAPTGGYLLQACVSTGHAAGNGVLARLAGK